jgi:nucleoside transporter
MSDLSASQTDPGIKMKLFMMMLIEIFIWGAWQPKIFDYMGMLGFDEGQMGLAGSVFAFGAVLGIFFSNQFADRNFSAEKFLAASNLIAGICLIAASQVTSFWPFFLLFVAHAIVYVPTIAVTNSIAFTHLRDPAGEFGFVRAGGTVGWIVASWPFIFLLGKAADADQTKWILIVAGIGALVMAAFSLTLPHTPPKKTGHEGEGLAVFKALQLLAVPHIAVLYLVTLIDATIHNGYFVLSDKYLKDIGFPSNWTMVVMSLGQVAEIATMLVLGLVLKRLGWKWTMVLGVMGHAVRFAVFAFFPDSHELIVAIQLLHGICYAFFFATVYIYVDEAFPKDIRASAQGLFNLLILGVGLVAASFGFVWLRGRLTSDSGTIDYQTLFLVPTGMAAVAMLLLALFFNPPRASAPESYDESAVPERPEI